jgi:hypothetical protein
VSVTPLLAQQHIYLPYTFQHTLATHEHLIALLHTAARNVLPNAYARSQTPPFNNEFNNNKYRHTLHTCKKHSDACTLTFITVSEKACSNCISPCATRLTWQNIQHTQHSHKARLALTNDSNEDDKNLLKVTAIKMSCDKNHWTGASLPVSFSNTKAYSAAQQKKKKDLEYI